MAACQHCSATESACQWRDGCCEYCNHIEGRDLNATDPAVTAAAEALRDHGRMSCDFHGVPDEPDCPYCSAEWTAIDAAVAAARPIIEAEVRERIAADIEAHANRLFASGVTGELIAGGCLAAARIARGQS